MRHAISLGIVLDRIIGTDVELTSVAKLPCRNSMMQGPGPYAVSWFTPSDDCVKTFTGDIFGSFSTVLSGLRGQSLFQHIFEATVSPDEHRSIFDCLSKPWKNFRA